MDMTYDGTVYITGYLKKYIRRSTSSVSADRDCYVMRLDYKLNIVYLKSFGDYNYYAEDCRSIKVTRNNDYLYIGGQRENTATGQIELFFVKLTALADEFATPTKFLRYGNTVSLKRILLTQGRSFLGTNDQNDVYFCGHTSANNGDFFFGKLDNTFTFQAIYRYGSTETEMGADCTLTLDSQYLVGIFSTNYHKPRGIVTAPLPKYVDTSLSNVDLVSPFENCGDITFDVSTNMGKGIGGGAKTIGNKDKDGPLSLVSCNVMDVDAKIKTYFPGGVIPTATSGTDYCLDTYQ